MAFPALLANPSVASAGLSALGSMFGGGGSGPTVSTSGDITSDYFAPFIVGGSGKIDSAIDGGGRGDDAADLIGRTVSSIVPIMVLGVLAWLAITLIRKAG